MSTHDKDASGKYHILIDQKPYWVDSATITGAQIKKIAGIPSNYTLYQRVTGPGEDLPISDNQAVDLSQPGAEHFFSGITQTTEGDGFLPKADRSYLEDKGMQYEEVIVNGNRGVILKDYILPKDRYDHECADVLVLLPPGYNDVPPDMFFTYPWVKLKAEQCYASKADVPYEFNGIKWQRWSRHAPAQNWRPGIDGIPTIAARVHQAMKVASA
jgi:hypothetical protein